MTKKIASLAILAASSLLALSGCNNQTAAKKATLLGAYSSPAHLSYVNMRPNYNYFLTTFSFETIKLYDDGTYVLDFSASTFSGIVLPETGNDATGNERENYLDTFAGTYTSATDSFDPNVLNCKFSAPTSLMQIYNQKYYVDTANWSDAMKEATKVGKGTTDTTTGQTKVDHYDYYASGAEYLNGVTASDGDVLPAHNYAAFDASLDGSNASFDYVVIFEALGSAA
jgi:hypothetical protein